MEWIYRTAEFVQEDDGVTAIEYALLASIITLAAVGTMGALGTQLSDMMTFIKSKIVIS
jgi:pilus assembly protein Flp/PilA